MSRYGVTIFGSDTYGEVLAAGFVAFNFAATSTNYGEVTVAWREPSGTYNRQILLFNPSGPPIHEADGQVLFDHVSTDPNYHATRYVHTNLAQGRFFNYALFVYDTTGQIWRRVGIDEVLTTKNYGYTRRLYDGTPEVYKSTDFQALGNSSYTDEESFLYRFLSIIGFQLDTTRTEVETLRVTVDPRRVSGVVLPALGAQFGVSFEPQINGTSMRRLIAAATRLYAIKGTANGLRVLADVVTGWPSTVTAGKNLALDNLDAGPVGAPGRWTGAVAGASVSFHAPDASYAGAFGSGVLDLYFNTAGPLGGLTTSRSIGLDRVRTAIPIQAGTTYTMSQYLQAPDGTSDARVVMVWLDGQGIELSRSPGDYGQLGGALVRPTTTAVAPATAQYIEPVVEVVNRGGGNVAQGTHIYASGFQVEAAGAATSWEPARQTHLRMAVNRPIDVPVKSHRLALLLKDFIVPGSSVALEFVQLTGSVVGGVTFGGSATPSPSAASSAGSVVLGGSGSAFVAAVMGAAAGGVTLGGTVAVISLATRTVGGGVTLDGSALPSSSAAGSIVLNAVATAGSMAGAAVGGVTLGGTANVTGFTPGSAVGTVTLSGLGTAQAGATIAGTVTVSALVGAAAPAGAVGTISLGGTAAATSATAAAVGGVTLGGSVATGVVRGTAAGTLTLSGGTGTSQAVATAAGTVALGGTAAVTGFTPGSAAGTVTLTGTGSAQAIAVTAGTVAFGGTAAAAGFTAGSAAGTIALSGTVITSPVTAAASGSLTLGGSVNATAAKTVSGSLTLGGSATSQSLVSSAGLITLGGTTVAATVTAAASGSLTLGGSVSAAGAARAAGTIALGGTAATSATVQIIPKFTGQLGVAASYLKPGVV